MIEQSPKTILQMHIRSLISKLLGLSIVFVITASFINNPDDSSENWCDLPQSMDFNTDNQACPSFSAVVSFILTSSSSVRNQEESPTLTLYSRHFSRKRFRLGCTLTRLISGLPQSWVFQCGISKYSFPASS